MPFFKDDPQLIAAPLAPGQLLPANKPGWGADQRSMAKVFNRLGGLMAAFEARTGLDHEVVLALWQVECGGRVLTPGQMIIRFENHWLFNLWGKDNPAAFDQHFQIGGRAGIAGKPWTNHKFRAAAGDPWTTFHGDQTSEYRVLHFSEGLVGDNVARSAISMGGPQIMGFNADEIGYPDANAMYNAFQADERAHLLGFFDFCNVVGPHGASLIDALKAKDFLKFASGYNGNGQAPTYAQLVSAAYDKAKAL